MVQRFLCNWENSSPRNNAVTDGEVPGLAKEAVQFLMHLNRNSVVGCATSPNLGQLWWLNASRDRIRWVSWGLRTLDGGREWKEEGKSSAGEMSVLCRLRGTNQPPHVRPPWCSRECWEWGHSYRDPVLIILKFSDLNQEGLTLRQRFQCVC